MKRNNYVQVIFCLLLSSYINGELNYLNSITTSKGSQGISCVAPIQDQMQCNAGYIFAATAAFEFNFCQTHKIFIKFSEQQLLDCDTRDNGCNGGTPANALETVTLASNQLIMPFYPAASYNSSYVAMNGACLASTYQEFVPDIPFGMVQSVKNISLGSPATVEAIKQALNNYGPLVASMYQGGSFSTYKSGVYSDSNISTNCFSSLPTTLQTSSLNYTNHAVVLMGYGTDPNQGPYWLGRNSWGTEWGENGYFKIAQGLNLCNIESYLIAVTALL